MSGQESQQEGGECLGGTVKDTTGVEKAQKRIERGFEDFLYHFN